MEETADDELVLVFMPSLAAVLLHAEDEQGEPLTYEQVLEIRDHSVCMRMPRDVAERLAEERGDDLDPENCWHEWQLLRRQLGRLPDIDPGPKFRPLRAEDPEYLATIDRARQTLDEFRRRLPADGSPLDNGLVKTWLHDGEHSELLWLCAARRSGEDFIAEVFELPPTLGAYAVGSQVEVAASNVLDWMINDDGALSGGFSLRLHRSRLPPEEWADFDAYIGVETYV